MAARCGHILLSFVLVLVLVLVLVPCCFCFSSPSCSCRAPSASRARRARRARRGALLSSLSTLCRRGSRCPGCPPAPRIFLLACLSSCWKSSAGRTHTRRRARSRAKLCPHLFDVPICLSCLRRRSTTWSLTAQSSRARTVRWREFRAKLFFRAPQASAGGESRCRQSRRSRAQPPFPGEGARANSWGQLPSITAEMRHRASSHCTR